MNEVDGCMMVMSQVYNCVYRETLWFLISLETILLVLTKVGYLGILVGIQQDILRLEVSVDYHVSVAVVYSRNNLLEKTASFCVLHLKDMTWVDSDCLSSPVVLLKHMLIDLRELWAGSVCARLCLCVCVCACIRLITILFKLPLLKN